MTIAALLGLALLTRVAGALTRGPQFAWPWHLAAWNACGIAAWLMAAASGAWFPLWPVLVTATVAGLFGRRHQRSLFTVTWDVGIVVVMCLFAIPPLPFATAIAAALVYATVGFTADTAVHSRSAHAMHRLKVRMSAFGACVVLALGAAVAALAVAPTSPVYAWHTSSLFAPLNAGLAPDLAAERITLHNGAVAWVDRPSKQPIGGAVVFHGAHRDGSFQPAATVMRRALLGAGYVVVSVDHPGFGASPCPPSEARVEGWDSLPSARNALDYLQTQLNEPFKIIIGHSMGCSDVLRLLSDGADVDVAVMFGGGLPDQSHLQDWSDRFHALRRPEYRLEDEQIETVRTRYYDLARFARSLPEQGPPLIFAQFGIEHENLLAGRDELFETLPRYATRDTLEGCTHYFNSWRRGGFLVGDVRVARRLTRLFASLHEEHASESTQGDGE